MGTIINTVGYIKTVIELSLIDLQDDGTTIPLSVELRIGDEYEFIVYNNRTRTTYSVRGIFSSFEIDPFSKEFHDDKVISNLIIDMSTEHKSCKTRVNVKDIKSVKAIEKF